MDFEAMTTPSPDSFSKMAKSWMNLKRYEDGAQLCSLSPLFGRDWIGVVPPQPAQSVPKSSVRSRDVPFHQDHDRGSQHRLFITLSTEVLTAGPRSRGQSLHIRASTISFCNPNEPESPPVGQFHRSFKLRDAESEFLPLAALVKKRFLVENAK